MQIIFLIINPWYFSQDIMLCHPNPKQNPYTPKYQRKLLPPKTWVVKLYGSAGLER